MVPTRPKRVGALAIASLLLASACGGGFGELASPSAEPASASRRRPPAPSRARGGQRRARHAHLLRRRQQRDAKLG